MPTLTTPAAAAPKHTSGPLHIARMDDGTVVIYDDSFLARHVAWLPSGVPDAERDANAALFRAASDLLEALQNLLSAHHHSRGDEWVDAAYAVIAKAEGRA